MTKSKVHLLFNPEENSLTMTFVDFSKSPGKQEEIIFNKFLTDANGLRTKWLKNPESVELIKKLVNSAYPCPNKAHTRCRVVQL
jgi:type IV secretory pathway VirB6-like protein